MTKTLEEALFVMEEEIRALVVSTADACGLACVARPMVNHLTTMSLYAAASLVRKGTSGELPENWAPEHDVRAFFRELGADLDLLETLDYGALGASPPFSVYRATVDLPSSQVHFTMYGAFREQVTA